jgi:hypothetical protein
MVNKLKVLILFNKKIKSISKASKIIIKEIKAKNLLIIEKII